MVSGDQFISSKEVKERLIKEFQGDCAEMEGASIAHGAYLNGIPFVIIRAISDKADDSAEMDYPTLKGRSTALCQAGRGYDAADLRQATLQHHHYGATQIRRRTRQSVV